MNNWKTEFFKIIQFIKAQKSKCIYINLTKHILDLHAENNKMLMKEMREDLSKWRDVPCLWTGTQTGKGVCAPYTNHRFKVGSKRIPEDLSTNK